MAIGHPDYFGSAVFLKYGSVIRNEVGSLVLNTISQSSGEIALNGTIRSLDIWVHQGDTVTNPIIKVYVDGIQLISLQPDFLFAHLTVVDTPTFLEILEGDYINRRIVVRLLPDVIIHNTVEIVLSASSTDSTCYISYNLWADEISE